MATKALVTEIIYIPKGRIIGNGCKWRKNSIENE